MKSKKLWNYSNCLRLTVLYFWIQWHQFYWKIQSNKCFSFYVSNILVLALNSNFEKCMEFWNCKLQDLFIILLMKLSKERPIATCTWLVYCSILNSDSLLYFLTIFKTELTKNKQQNFLKWHWQMRVRPPSRHKSKIIITEHHYSVLHSDWSRAKLVIFISEMDQSENRTRHLTQKLIKK